ncbi:hypothetical protein DB42_BR00080 [Neochlamydia sp. EPS4]|nr:hypothetical protein DB42_BR00080 [Neochlamydia sp. EPS4]
MNLSSVQGFKQAYKVLNMVNYLALSKVDVPGELIQSTSRQLPFYVSTKDKEKTTQLLRLFKNTSEVMPSRMAELSLPSEHQMFTIRLIDKLFFEAINEYRQSFIYATAKDMSYVPLEDGSNFTYAMCVGACQFATKTPNLPVVKQIIGPILMLSGAIWGILKKDRFARIKIAQEKSLHRKKWFKEVLIKEELRKQAAVELINKRARNLKRQIEELGDDLVDDALIDELKILDKFMHYFSPNTPLLLDDIPFKEYMEQKEID